MKKKLRTLAAVLVIFLAGLSFAVMLLTPQPEGIPNHILELAQNSKCMETGTLQSTYVYNENSKTWWIDLEVDDKPLCNPACVVYEETEHVEINWRCTGLI